MAYLLIIVAIFANVLTNVSLKKLTKSIDWELSIAIIPQLLFSAWAWLAFISGISLIFCFMASLKYFPMPIVYGSIVAGALGLLSVVSWMVFGEELSTLNLAGIAAVTVGLFLLLMG